MTLRITIPAAAELPELADVAAKTFPLACPPSVSQENVAAFIDENLSEARFADYLADPDRVLLIARQDGRMIGYAMLIRGVPDDDDVQRAVVAAPGGGDVEDVRAARQPRRGHVGRPDVGGGRTGRRTRCEVRLARRESDRTERAQRFYTKHGFSVNGTKTFRLGSRVENDYVMVRPV